MTRGLKKPRSNLAAIVAVVIAIPPVGYWRFQWHPILSFWFAYVAKRPFAASFADWMGKQQSVGGLWGDGTVPLALTLVILCLVAYLGITRRDVQQPRRASRHLVDARAPTAELPPEELSRASESHRKYLD